MANRFDTAMRSPRDGCMQRKLAIAVAAGVPGRRPMDRPEAATLQRVTACRQRFLDPRFAARATALCVLALCIAGCAMQAAKPAYVGVFTGEFVDGLPLYRLPSIDVIGWRARSNALDGS
jgi:hypothetical protein